MSKCTTPALIDCISITVCNSTLLKLSIGIDLLLVNYTCYITLILAASLLVIYKSITLGLDTKKNDIKLLEVV